MPCAAFGFRRVTAQIKLAQLGEVRWRCGVVERTGGDLRDRVSRRE